MVCYHPVRVYIHKYKRTPTGRQIVEHKPPDSLKAIKAGLSVWRESYRPCGYCIGCRLDNSRSWAIRCMHEMQLHEQNSFLTFTYDDDHVPWSSLTGEQTLVKKDMQDFWKLLRYYFPEQKIKYLCAGEYGENTHRPHYHAILFGKDFREDKYLYKQNFRGENYYISPTLTDIWEKGHVIIGDVTFDSAAYVSRYVMKKVYGEPAVGYYYGQQPEFLTCSTKPAIGLEWYEKYKGDIYPYDEVIIRSNGKIRRMKPPRYYDKKLEEEDPELFEEIKQERMKKAKSKEEEIESDRMYFKEMYKLKSIEKLRRELE